MRLCSVRHTDLMDHSLGTHAFQLAKKTVDKVISVRYLEDHWLRSGVDPGVQNTQENCSVVIRGFLSNLTFMHKQVYPKQLTLHSRFIHYQSMHRTQELDKTKAVLYCLSHRNANAKENKIKAKNSLLEINLTCSVLP